MPNSAPAAPRPSVASRGGRRSRALLAALLLSAPVSAVQLPKALLAEPAPLSLKPYPAPRPLAGLDSWRLYSVFSRGDGQGLASLSLDDGRLLSVQAGDRLPDGIEVLAVERDRLLLRRGAQVGELVIQGRALRAPDAASLAVDVEPAAMLPVLPAGCESFVQAGVPLDELQALGGCPTAADPSL
ncbi:hypothetical protein [Pseudomonas tohonis]|uniref:hypothetical protein n=1 Tax=Pseudomonas tohonis TaxID=2725477 RepID=UPI0022F09526|nr:hypothetical protein [Pseudomonas tohonis]